MLRALLSVLALGAAVATPATAGPPSDDLHFRGGCGLDAVAPPGSDTFSGVVYGSGVAYSTWHEHNPVTVTYLTCVLKVDGTPLATVSGNGVGPVVVAGPEPVTYTVAPHQIVYVCESFELVDAHGRTYRETDVCARTPGNDLIPFSDEIGEVWEYYLGGGAVWGVVDPVVCAALAGQAGTYAGLVTIQPGGDVYAGDAFLYDCPPYETGAP